MGRDRTFLTLDSDEFTTLIHQSAGLRGRGNFQQAVELVGSNLHKLHHDCLENAYLKLIYAAREGWLPEVAQRYAELLAAIDSNIPTVKKVLGENS
jgi:hypothetical protein